MDYKDISIEKIEKLYKQNTITFLCDADSNKITIEYDEYMKEIIETLEKAFKEIVKTVETISLYIVKTFRATYKYKRKLLEKKISKKKFIKLLQSRGIQRNQINAIVYNNKDKYTLVRYITTIPPAIVNKKIESRTPTCTPSLKKNSHIKRKEIS